MEISAMILELEIYTGILANHAREASLVHNDLDWMWFVAQSLQTPFGA
jgi:hypothetical protein